MAKSNNEKTIINKTLTKQELANKIWSVAEELRGSIDASEYKNFLLELIFYKNISEKFEEIFSKEVGDIKNLKCFIKTKEYLKENENNLSHCDYTEEELKYIKENLNNKVGYFIEYPFLYSSWIKNNLENFDILTLNNSISSFNKNVLEFIDDTDPQRCSKTPLFQDMFNSLSNELNKLGSSPGEQTRKLKSLIETIKEIPVKKNNFDVLGYVYEYLIAKFASTAGKKGGEFYTPHEVSLLMAEIVANHLKGETEEISVYDSASGSGSLLRNIGDMYNKITDNSNEGIRYYAQELNTATCKLTKMNLIINGIQPKAICVQNADTLKDDWPIGNDEEPLRVHAVVSNPPYSQNWKPEEHKDDIRFENYGLAPSSKADFAFLLHDLHHVKDGGILTIVLPHGVLFRGGTEKQIREKLIKNANIKAIIGLPANMFYGTSISTIIMILKKEEYSKRTKENNILFVDASNLYKQEGKKNKFLASHIKKIVDVVNARKEIPGFSKIVNFSEIKENDFNLNISRYLDNFKKEEEYNLYSTIYGEISETELNLNFKSFFENFPDLKQELFKEGKNKNHFKFKDVDQIQELLFNSKNVQKYLQSFENINKNIFNLFKSNLSSWQSIQKVINKPYFFEERISNFVFKHLEEIPLFENYNLYQILMDELVKINEDFEYLMSKQNSGENENIILDSIKEDTDKKEKTISKKQKSSEVQNVILNWEHPLFTKDLVASYFFKDLLSKKEMIQSKISEIEEEIESIDETIDEENRSDIEYFTDGKLDKTKLRKLKKPFLQEVKNDESILISSIISIYKLYQQLEEYNLELKDIDQTLINSTYDKFKNLSFEEFNTLLLFKWIQPIQLRIISYSKTIILEYVQKLENLASKYSDVIEDLTSEIKKNEEQLAILLSELTTENNNDLKAINKLINILK
ncbi:type I restriction-modification system subunit M [Mesomycoplasma hyorhinis]|uniref:site-specific DNA-methyltransferase (adenine-specific) n=1 Tax=Mesomycoplasma hyorhinis TaxID=2100 RepID=A0ABD6IEC6_MESHY|nr:type I restriction-modification system subunit M [Mesomycoplasma hyorhinis]MXR07465.1 type I restriction-modification system subunit M [Mesomycoplasma hyorhinis]MXR11836.1 type I restriction-modification system subunit M [Mesomycoplasma hyorhinis]MXR38983.1 type I restriction-modification system subunit M [Mesomycoplasma hyorhinis]MXR43938.1 type I restriction-modification system subunit M [Mesomycoplasma hyorhinis]